MREAETLRASGFRVLIAGVVSSDEAERRLELDGTTVVRLAPGEGLRRKFRSGSAAVCPGVLEVLGDIRPRSPSSRGSASLRARLRRLALTLAYYAEGVRLAVRVRPALVHANDYNTMWIGVAAKLLVRRPGDLRLPRAVGRPQRPAGMAAWLIACEALFVRVADVTITASPGYAQAIASRYRVSPPRVVRNIPRVPFHAPGRNGNRNPPVAVYLGGVMPGRGLEQAIEALGLAPEIRLRVIGPGRAPYRASLVALARAAGVEDRTEIRDALPLSEALDAIAECEMGLC